MGRNAKKKRENFRVWRNFISEFGAISFGSLAQFRLAVWRNISEWLVE